MRTYRIFVDDKRKGMLVWCEMVDFDWKMACRNAHQHIYNAPLNDTDFAVSFHPMGDGGFVMLESVNSHHDEYTVVMTIAADV